MQFVYVVEFEESKKLTRTKITTTTRTIKRTVRLGSNIIRLALYGPDKGEDRVDAEPIKVIKYIKLCVRLINAAVVGHRRRQLLSSGRNNRLLNEARDFARQLFDHTIKFTRLDVYHRPSLNITVSSCADNNEPITIRITDDDALMSTTSTSWRQSNDGYRPKALREATRTVFNSEGTTPSKGVEAALVDKTRFTNSNDPKLLSRLGIFIDKNGKLIVKPDAVSYMTCRRSRLMPYPSYWANVGIIVLEVLMLLLLIGGLSCAAYQIDNPDLLAFGVVNMRTLMVCISVLSTVWILVLFIGALTNAKNEKLAYETITSRGDLALLYEKVQFNCPQIRWGFLHQLLFAVGHWVNFAYLQAEIADSNMGGSTFPTFSEGLSRLYRVRIWLLLIMCTLQVSIMIMDYFDCAHAMLYMGPATEITDERTVVLCEPIDGGNKFNYEGNMKFAVDGYNLARWTFLFMNFLIVYELISQLVYFRNTGNQFSPETWRTIVLAEWCIAVIMVALLGGAAMSMVKVPCARAQAVKAFWVYAVFFVGWILLWAIGYNDFITTTGRQSLLTQADRDRFENMLWFHLLISSEFLYLNVAPWLRCQLNNGMFETVLEYVPDLL